MLTRAKLAALKAESADLQVFMDLPSDIQSHVMKFTRRRIPKHDRRYMLLKRLLSRKTTRAVWFQEDESLRYFVIISEYFGPNNPDPGFPTFSQREVYTFDKTETIARCFKFHRFTALPPSPGTSFSRGWKPIVPEKWCLRRHFDSLLPLPNWGLDLSF